MVKNILRSALPMRAYTPPGTRDRTVTVVPAGAGKTVVSRISATVTIWQPGKTGTSSSSRASNLGQLEPDSRVGLLDEDGIIACVLAKG